MGYGKFEGFVKPSVPLVEPIDEILEETMHDPPLTKIKYSLSEEDIMRGNQIATDSSFINFLDSRDLSDLPVNVENGSMVSTTTINVARIRNTDEEEDLNIDSNKNTIEKDFVSTMSDFEVSRCNKYKNDTLDESM